MESNGMNRVISGVNITDVSKHMPEHETEEECYSGMPEEMRQILAEMRETKKMIEWFDKECFSDHIETIDALLQEFPMSREELAWEYIRTYAFAKWMEAYDKGIRLCLEDLQERDAAFLNRLKELILGKGEGDETEIE